MLIIRTEINGKKTRVNWIKSSAKSLFTLIDRQKNGITSVSSTTIWKYNSTHDPQRSKHIGCNLLSIVSTRIRLAKYFLPRPAYKTDGLSFDAGVVHMNYEPSTSHTINSEPPQATPIQPHESHCNRSAQIATLFAVQVEKRRRLAEHNRTRRAAASAASASANETVSNWTTLQVACVQCQVLLDSDRRRWLPTGRRDASETPSSHAPW